MIENAQIHFLQSAQDMYDTQNAKDRIRSFWDMLQIDTRSFMASLSMLGGTVGEYKTLLTISRKIPNVFASSSLEARAHILQAIKNLEENCKTHGLNTTARMAESAFNTCLKSLAGDGWFEPRNLQNIVTTLEGLLSAAVAEAESRKFYALSEDVEDGHDSADALLGTQVVDIFPNAAFDISEAGKCLSFGLWTACVMHTMRVIEIGLQALAQHVGVEPSDNWNKTLNEIEAALRQVDRRTAEAGAEQAAAEAGTHLRFIKNAWSNQAMHHISKYDEREAREIFNNARSFMRHIAEMTGKD